MTEFYPQYFCVFAFKNEFAANCTTIRMTNTYMTSAGTSDQQSSFCSNEKLKKLVEQEKRLKYKTGYLIYSSVAAANSF